MNCGRDGNIQVIHCDRLRKCKVQLLSGEDPYRDMRTEPVLVSDQEQVDSPTDDFGKKEVFVEKRQWRKPAWFTDYVFSAFGDSNIP